MQTGPKESTHYLRALHFIKAYEFSWVLMRLYESARVENLIMNRSALLIAGDGLYFLKEALEFREFLKKSVGIENIRIIPTAYLPVEKIIQKIEEFMRDANGPALLIFTGHGSKHGWGLSFNVLLPYEKIAELLVNYPHRLTIINDCCYGGAIIELLKKYDGSDNKFSIIAATTEEYKTGSGLTLDVLDAWRNGSAYSVPVWRLKKIYLLSSKNRASFRGRINLLLDATKSAISEKLNAWFPDRFRVVYGGRIDDLGHEVVEDAGIWQSRNCPQRWGAEFDSIFFKRASALEETNLA